MLLEFLRSLGGGMGAMKQPMPEVQAPQPQTGMFGGLSRFNENHPGLLYGAGQLVAGNDISPAVAYGMGARKEKAQRAEQQQKENATRKWLLSKGIPEAEVDAALASGQIGQYFKPGTDAKAPQVETFYDESGRPYKAQWDSQSGNWSQVGGAKGDEGFEITTADGTTIRQGAFGNQDQKNMANRITEGQDRAKAASDLKRTVKLMRSANQNTGYSGPGSGVYGAVDDAMEQFGLPGLPGSAGARATMRSQGLDVALAQVQKTKGAISNAEMGLFMASAPGMQQTPQGNAALLDILDAVADREIARQGEMEKWRQTHGTLDGFEGAWSQWVEQNPLIMDNGQGGVTLAGPSGAAGGGPSADGWQDMGNGVRIRRKQ